MSHPENPHVGQNPKTSSKTNKGARQSHILRKIVAIIIALGMIALGVYFMLGCQSLPKQESVPQDGVEGVDICLSVRWASSNVGAEEPKQEAAHQESAPQDGVEAVDMGLSVRWASSNVGAEEPKDDGNYFAWGEVAPSSNYVWRNSSTYERVVDGEVLPSSMDAATTLGDGWRMPTIEEFEELMTKCEWRYCERDGRLGYNITASNGNVIFLPASGYIYDTLCFHRDVEGLYWCSNIYAEDDDDKHAIVLKLSNRDIIFEPLYRYYGAQVRAVRE